MNEKEIKERVGDIAEPRLGDDKQGLFVPADDDVNAILKQYISGQPVIKEFSMDNGFKFSLRIPSTRVLNIAERATSVDVGLISKDMTVSEYNTIKNTNVIVSFVESIGCNDFSTVEVKDIDSFNIKKNLILDHVTAGIESLLLQKIFEFQQTELAAFDSKNIKNS